MLFPNCAAGCGEGTRAKNSGWLRDFLVCAALVATSLLILWPLFHGEFINLDDNHFVVENWRLREGLTAESVKWAFSAHLFYSTPTAEYFQPITLLSRLLDVTLFGFDPRGHHASSIAIHLASVVLLYFTISRLTRRWVLAAFVAALFAAHPINVEPVAWISARKDVVCGLFTILTLLAFVQYCEKPAVGRYLVLIGLFCAAAMTKPMVVSLPVVLLLLNYWPLCRWTGSPGTRDGMAQKGWRRLILEIVPLILIAVATSCLALLAQRDLGATAAGDMIPWHVRGANVVGNYGSYLAKFVYPHGFSPIYPHLKTVAVPEMIAGIFLLGGITAATFKVRRRYPSLLVGWLWFVAVIAPVSGIVPIGATRMGDRYMYTALIGLALGIGGMLLELQIPRLRKILLPSWVGAFAVLVFLAHGQAKIWCTAVGLFTQMVEQFPENPRANFNLAEALLNAEDFDKAAHYYQRSIELSDGRWHSPYVGLGETLFREGRPRAAEKVLQRASFLDPTVSKTFLELGVVRAELGDYRGARGSLNECIRLYPYFPNAFRCRARVSAKQEQWDAAVKDARRLVELEPDSVANWKLLRHFESQRRRERAESTL